MEDRELLMQDVAVARESLMTEAINRYMNGRSWSPEAIAHRCHLKSYPGRDVLAIDGKDVLEMLPPKFDSKREGDSFHFTVSIPYKRL
jgi:hypothetical protein